MMDNFNWRFLPQAGGLLDQDESLMRDILTVAWRKSVLEKMTQSIALPPGVARRRTHAPTPEAD